MRLIQRNGHRRRPGVTVTVEIEEKPVGRHVEPSGDGLDDTKIRLVRDDARDVIHGQTRAVEYFQAGAGHRVDGLLERLFAHHLEGVEALIDVVLRDRAA